MTLQELIAKRTAAATAIQELRAKLDESEERVFDATEQETWDTANADYDRLSTQLDVAQRAADVEAAQTAPVEPRTGPVPGHEPTPPESRGPPVPDGEVTEEHRADAMQGWFAYQSGEDVSERQATAAEQCGLNLGRPTLTLTLARSAPRTVAEARALSAIDGSAGGFTAPDSVMRPLELAMLAFGGMRQVSQIIRTTDGNDMPWPTSDDTGNKGRMLGENKAVTVTDPTFGQLVWKAYKGSSDLVKVPVELLEDSAFDMAQILGEMLGERLGRLQNEKFTTGDGAAGPYGIVERATTGKTAAAVDAITADEIQDLIYSVDPAYRNGARFMMNDAVILAIRKLKDGNGQYLWQPPMQAGEPSMLFGYPLTTNQDMASSIATTAKTIIFGDLTKYKIREVRSVRLRRLVERYADNDQEGFVAFVRFDGNLLDAGTNPVKRLVQA